MKVMAHRRTRNRRQALAVAANQPKGKGTIRILVRRGSRSDRSPLVAKRVPGLADPTACERCGAVFARKAWHRGPGFDLAVLGRATWGICPACQQIARGEFYGLVRIDGSSGLDEDAILKRVENVAERAGFTQPERRIVEIRREGDSLEVRTTSQKLAHRIACELAKAFGGETRYAWSDRDGRLFATWHPRRR